MADDNGGGGGDDHVIEGARAEVHPTISMPSQVSISARYLFRGAARRSVLLDPLVLSTSCAFDFAEFMRRALA
jgi:hypothetical protein